MSDSADHTTFRQSREATDESPCTDDSSSRPLVGVVRVLRGRLGAPCRCCSEAAYRAQLEE